MKSKLRPGLLANNDEVFISESYQYSEEREPDFFLQKLIRAMMRGAWEETGRWHRFPMILSVDSLMSKFCHFFFFFKTGEPVELKILMDSFPL